MTELAYMVREDWAQRGTAMVPQSTVIREWIGEAPYLFAVTDVKEFNRDDRNADHLGVRRTAPGDAGEREGAGRRVRPADAVTEVSRSG